MGTIRPRSKKEGIANVWNSMAGSTGFEPATSGLTEAFPGFHNCLKTLDLQAGVDPFIFSWSEPKIGTIGAREKISGRLTTEKQWWAGMGLNHHRTHFQELAGRPPWVYDR